MEKFSTFPRILKKETRSGKLCKEFSKRSVISTAIKKDLNLPSF
jgi:hypothetical protein